MAFSSFYERHTDFGPLAVQLVKQFSTVLSKWDADYNENIQPLIENDTVKDLPETLTQWGRVLTAAQMHRKMIDAAGQSSVVVGDESVEKIRSAITSLEPKYKVSEFVEPLLDWLQSLEGTR